MEIQNSLQEMNISSKKVKPEIRIGVLGNVDSGKSNAIGVIKNVLDDGKGYRDLVMKILMK